ncbi:MAG: phage tail sheath subtilisin-like domain-containing protein [Chloroflexi bacterium]|nr:phage tail sheath subtilisin-like domain-containing protein [Chloroflexota bacterium]
MPEYLAPGVYVEEVPSGNQPIEGVSTSTAGMVGVTQRGPVNSPTFVSSFPDFVRKFGGYLDHRVYGHDRAMLPYAVEGFFANGGTRLFVTRIVGTNADFSQVTLFGSSVTNAAATALSSRANDGATLLEIDDGTNIAVADVLLLQDGTRSEYVTVAAAPVAIGMRIFGQLHSDHGAVAVAIQTQVVGADLTARINGAMNSGATALNLNNSAGLVAGEVIRIQDTDDPDLTEYVTITANNAPDFDEPGLLFDHPQATTEIHRVTLTDGAGEPGGRTVDTGASTGDFVIPLTNTTNMVAGQIVRVDDEFYVIQNIVSQLSIATTPTTAIHGVGVAVIKQVPLLQVYARYEGIWGDDLRISVRPSSILETTVSANAGVGDNPILLNATFGLSTGSVLSVTTGGTQVLRQRVTSVDTRQNEVSLTGGAAAAITANQEAVSIEFDLIVERLDADGRVVEGEEFVNLSLDPEHPRYALDILGHFDVAANEPEETGQSNLIRLADLVEADLDAATINAAEAANRRLTIPFDGVDRQLENGDDDLATIDANTYIGTPSIDPDERTGLYSLENIDDIKIVAIPGRSDQDIQNALISHCNLKRYRFAVLDAPEGATLKGVQSHRQLFDDTRAALYHPWFIIGDRFGRNGDVVSIPPSGHVIGIYARSDNTRGVHKAPANEVVLGIRDVQVRLNKAEQDLLNPKHINVVRDFRENTRGIRVWGARTLSSNPEWRYINVRRLFLFVEESIERGMQFAVFEPNSEFLWATVKRSITNFLTSVWRDGALEGVTPEEAFFVNIGYGLTMTQDDIDNGRMIVVVGIAPVKPAEFVIIRISQKTREATG